MNKDVYVELRKIKLPASIAGIIYRYANNKFIDENIDQWREEHKKKTSIKKHIHDTFEDHGDCYGGLFDELEIHTYELSSPLEWFILGSSFNEDNDENKSGLVDSDSYTIRATECPEENCPYNCKRWVIIDKTDGFDLW